MEILFENYVTFIDGGTSDGVGFFVGNFFITAGHVFNEGQTHSIYVNGQRIVLEKSEAIFINFPNGDFFSPDIPDVAIFDWQGLIALSFLQKICLLSVKN